MRAATRGSRGPGGGCCGTKPNACFGIRSLLRALAQADARAAKIAEMRLFGGMEHEQIARVLGLSRSVVVNDWQFARAWLAAKMKGGEARRPSVEIPREGSGVSRV